jgi:uncharacterized protein (TIGR03083 family)
MPRSLTDALRWMQQGTMLLTKEAEFDDEALGVPCALPGWTRRHLLAHLAANADALGNLMHWAATGEPTPMYSSPADRVAGIERGSRLHARELLAWLRHSSESLQDAMTRLRDEQWRAPVVTAQGRTVLATEVPWLRSREVFVHGVDLATGLSFADLPDGFLAALCDDVIAKRTTDPGPALVLKATDTGQRWRLPGHGQPVALAGPLAEITAYLAGRTHRLTTADGAVAPSLPPWL